MKKAITILREARHREIEFNPSRKATENNSFIKPSGIVKTLDSCSRMYDCDKCQDGEECYRLYERLINTNRLK